MSIYSTIIKIKKSRLVNDTFSYTFFNILEKAIPFFVLPIITRLLSKEEVGYYIFYQALISILIPLMTMNFDSSILLNYYKLSKEEFRIYFSNGLIIFLVIYSFLFLVAIALSNPISEWIDFPALWFKFVLLIIFFEFFTVLRKNLWRVKYKIKIFGIFSIMIALLNNGIGLILVFNSDLGWKGMIIGHFIGYLIFAIYSYITFYFEHLVIFQLKKTFIKDLIVVSFPLSLHRIGLWLGDTANKIIINSLLGATATGNYGIGAFFGSVITLIENAFNKAFTPYLFDKLSNIDKSKEKEIVKISYAVYFFLFIIAFFVFIFGYFGVGIIFGDQYLPTKVFILPLTLAAMFKGFNKLHVNYIFYTKRTFNITQITLTTGILNVILSYFMIQKFGLVGAAYTMLFISFLQYILSFYVGNKMIPMPWLYFMKK